MTASILSIGLIYKRCYINYNILKDIHRYPFGKGAVSMAVVNTRKLRKLGNSKVLTIPDEVIKTLGIHEGQKIAFNVENGQVVLQAVTTDSEEMDILSMAEEVSNQYDSALKDLVNR